ncbi:MAG: lysozyme [Patescibacteria group bacterium]|nr:lysozyme [Patescibacteria group bacterium]
MTAIIAWLKANPLIAKLAMVSILIALGYFIFRIIKNHLKNSRKMNSQEWQPDADTFQEIRNAEGFAPQAYYDGEAPNSPNRYIGGAGNLTIGYGHKIVPGDPYTEGSTITKDQAETLLEKDAAPRIAYVKSHITGELTKPQFDAIFDFYYNTGAGPYEASIWDKINNGASNKVISDWFKTNFITSNGVKLPGLVKRAAWRAAQWA